MQNMISEEFKNLIEKKMKKTVPSQNPKSVFEIDNPDRDYGTIKYEPKMQPERLDAKPEFKINQKSEFKHEKQPDFKFEPESKFKFEGSRQFKIDQKSEFKHEPQPDFKLEPKAGFKFDENTFKFA